MRFSNPANYLANPAPKQLFRRTEAEESVDALTYRVRSEKWGAEDATEHAMDRFAPGEYAQICRDAPTKTKPTTDLDRQLLAELSRAPVPLGFVSNALLYSTEFRSWGKRERKTLCSLFKGGLIKMMYTPGPSQYWLVARPGNFWV